ncbi:hypothetical protein QYZ88_011290 [Lachnospiraceae bacterium C1.1]|nr:hypothetical protein [Lachnospiraceae bacterium C1.1]
MKLKYYLRGLGIGMMVTAIVLTLSFTSRSSSGMTDSEIREKARNLGMTDSNELLITNNDSDTGSTEETEATASE